MWHQGWHKDGAGARAGTVTTRARAQARSGTAQCSIHRGWAWGWGELGTHQFQGWCRDVAITEPARATAGSWPQPGLGKCPLGTGSMQHLLGTRPRSGTGPRLETVRCGAHQGQEQGRSLGPAWHWETPLPSTVPYYPPQWWGRGRTHAPSAPPIFLPQVLFLPPLMSRGEPVLQGKVSRGL